MPEGEVTELLAQWGRGERDALDSLMPIVYSELRAIADGYLRRERTGHTLQPTALVHEAWLRLVKQEHPNFENRRRFYALAAQVMRKILVDHARGLNTEKRGGKSLKTCVGVAVDSSADNADDFLALDDALVELARVSPRKAQVIELRYFGGLNVEEMSDLLGVSIATISREQKTAEAWLSHAITAGE